MSGGPKHSRRAFLGTLGRASAVAACSGIGPWIVGCAASVPRVAPGGDGRVARVPLSMFDEGPGLLVDNPAGGLPIYLHRHDDGRFTAVLTRCTHQGCEVDPVPGRLICPCHGSEYTPDGVVLQGPAERPLPRYEAEPEGGEVRVDLSSEVTP